MKNIFIVALMLIGFSATAQSQENKKQPEKGSCCASDKKSEAVANASGCTAPKVQTADGNTVIPAPQDKPKPSCAATATVSGNPPAEGTVKESCKADASCCGAKPQTKA